jgi:hypothetical protein
MLGEPNIFKIMAELTMKDGAADLMKRYGP